MKVYAQLHGKFIGVDPAKSSVVYDDRTSGGAWETIELVDVGDHWYVPTFVAANVVLSMQPDGSLQTRPAGTQGEYEQFRATTQPDGLNLLYRVKDGQLIEPVLTITEAQ